MEYIDAHTHITNKDLELYLEDVKRAREAHVERAMLVATEEEEVALFEKLKDLAFFDFAYGLFPGDVHTDYLERLERLATRHRSFKFSALGEIGLDYHYDDSDKKLQKAAFIKQIELANELGLPVFIHTRDASKDTFDILKSHRPLYGCMMHCFSESKELAKEYVKLGFYISFSGTITFKNNRRGLESLKEVPLDRLLIETDAPYLSPVPKRGERNKMSHIVYTYERIAELKGVSLEELTRQVSANYARLYHR